MAFCGLSERTVGTGGTGDATIKNSGRAFLGWKFWEIWNCVETSPDTYLHPALHAYRIGVYT